MLRDAFGAFGALESKLLAKAIILAGLLPREFRVQFGTDNPNRSEWKDAFERLAKRSPTDIYSKAITLWLNLVEAQEVLTEMGDRAAGNARMLSSVTSELWETTFGAGIPIVRLAIARVHDQLNLHEIVELLTQPDTGVCSVLFAGRVETELQWNWPLQIGVPETPAGKRLLQKLEQGRYRDLYEPRVIIRSDEECDLLLLPELLEPAGALPIDLDTIRAGAMLVMEEKPPRSADILQNFTDFAIDDGHFGVIGVGFVMEADWLAWINTLIRELSHNATLDHALFLARLGEQRRWENSSMPETDFAPPFLAGDPWFLEQSRIALTALRIADSMQSAPQRGIANADVVAMGVQLANEADRRVWISERGDARDVIERRRKAEAAVGPLSLAPIRAADATPEFARAIRSASSRAAPRMRSAARPPEAATADFTAPAAAAPAPGGVEVMAATGDEEPPKESPAETRHVQCKILDGDSGSHAVKQLEARHQYRALVHIGAEIDAGALVADVPFDESQLPPSEKGHDLQVVFCPLNTRDGKDGIVPAMVKTIHLPRRGTSDIAGFNFETGQDAQAFRARILILHRNRILQTLMLAAPEPGTDFALRQENLVSPAFASSESEKPADLALVINDNPAGLPGITAIANGGASFSEPAGLNVTLDTIQSLLSKSNIDTAGENLKLNDQKLVDLMIQLATHGFALARELKRQMNLVDFQLATRVQVVEARSKAYLPVEFVYTGKAPDINAKLCPNASKALTAVDGSVHAACEHANDPQHVCPAAFWGFSKCIERQPFGQSEQHVFNIPQPGADMLAPFKVAVLAASEKVTTADLTGAKGVKSAIAALASDVRLAKSWTAWKTEILARPDATLLVLLPHSDNSPDFVNMPALEIQKKWLTSVQLDTDYVVSPGSTGPGPVVLLLGCSTALADIPFLNFVREFKAAGATIVLGTLATVHGTHASRFVRSLLGKIKAKGTDANGMGRPFDEILLEVKREMLAEGEPFVLSLAAYGHSSWRIQT